MPALHPAATPAAGHNMNLPLRPPFQSWVVGCCQQALFRADVARGSSLGVSGVRFHLLIQLTAQYVIFFCSMTY
jgi:hypothetical protein